MFLLRREVDVGGVDAVTRRMHFLAPSVHRLPATPEIWHPIWGPIERTLSKDGSLQGPK